MTTTQYPQSMTTRALAIAHIEAQYATILGVPTTEALASKSDDFVTDLARACGIIYACHGCGTTGGVRPGTSEADRIATRDVLDPDGLCCADADQTIF